MIPVRRLFPITLAVACALIAGCQNAGMSPASTSSTGPAVPAGEASAGATAPGSAPATAPYGSSPMSAPGSLAPLAPAPGGSAPGGRTTPGPAAPTVAAPAETRAYVFGWGDLPASLARPRGGTTRGAPVTLAPPQPMPMERGIADRFERDRAAILALAGNYKVSFHFMETLGLTADYKPSRAYHSWATEQVRILEDRGTFISLQHTLAMFFAQPDGSASAPALVKHWRQDWTYSDRDMHTFRGASTWERRRPDEAEAFGSWSQAVFQVDDSPRYEALGHWEHRGNLSIWNGEREMRPLPRREFSTRNDYDVLEGEHRIVLTPTGWLHEQRNRKRVAGETAGEAPRYLAEEYGLDRYERISSPDLAAADRYWEKTGGYWAAVRRAWADEMSRRDRFALRPEVDGRKLFEVHFEYADKLEQGAPFDAADAERHARTTIRNFMKE